MAAQIKNTAASKNVASAKVGRGPSKAKILTKQDVLGKKIVESVREARNAGKVSLASFKDTKDKDGSAVSSAKFLNDKGVELTIKAVQKVDAKIPQYVLEIRKDKEVQVFRGEVARNSFNVATKAVKGPRRKQKLDDNTVAKLEAWF